MEEKQGLAEMSLFQDMESSQYLLPVIEELLRLWLQRLIQPLGIYTKTHWAV